MAERAEEFFQMSLDMLCIAGVDGFFKVLNPAWEALLGYTDEELKSRPFIEFVHPDDRASTLEEAGKLATGEHTTVSFVNRYQAADGGYKWLLWSSRLSRDQQELLAVARDITEMKSTELRLRDAMRTAQAANAAKSEFLANMSHELRTPLNSVIGFAKVLAKNKHDNLLPAQLDFLGRISRAGEHLLSLINDVLDLSKIEAGHMDVVLEPVEIGGLLGDLQLALEPLAAARGISLQVVGDDDLQPLLADRQRLHQIVLNLASNAIKFTHEGGVRIRVVASDGQVGRVDVVDTGIGIPREKLDDLFDAFVQADTTTTREYGGTGLGLSISQALADMMGFRIVVDSVVGVGSTFSLLLRPDASQPRHERPAGMAVTAPSSTPVAPPEDPPEVTEDRERLVLIVDDDPDARAVLDRTLSDDGYRVVTADRAEAAFAIAQVLPLDIIVLDLMMPDEDGASLLKRLRSAPATRHIPVVVVSIVATDSRESIAGAQDAIDKPWEPDHLRSVVRRLLDDRAETVLIIDDNPDARVLMRDIAEAGGATVLEASGGAQALAMLESNVPDLILCDLMMPRVDGLMFMRALRADPRYRHIRVVAVTANQLTDEQQAALSRNQAEVVAKDGAFGENLARALQGGAE